MSEIITVLSLRTIKLQGLESNLLISYLSSTGSMTLKLYKTQKLVIIPCPSTLNEKSHDNSLCKTAPNVIQLNYYLLFITRRYYR